MGKLKKFITNKRVWALIVTIALLVPLLNISDTYAKSMDTSSESLAESSDTENLKAQSVKSTNDYLLGASNDSSIKYINADFYDYDLDTLNKTINAMNASSTGGNRLLIGTGGPGYQNLYNTNPKGIVANLAKSTLDSNSNIAFNVTTANLFPNSNQTVANGIEAKYNYSFPLQKDSNGYYSFNSDNGSQGISVVDPNGYSMDATTGRTVLNYIDYNSLSGYWPFNTKASTSKNFYFGTKFSTTFMMPEDGKVDGNDMTFEFSGDDDVWVYIGKESDGASGMKLCMDIGGIHDTYSGSINFATGLITFTPVGYSYNASTNKCEKVSNYNSNKTYYYYLYSKDEYQKSGLTQSIKNFVGLSREEYANYSFKMFYMERGANLSNCKMRLNFPIVPDRTVKVKKTVDYTYNNEYVTDQVNGQEQSNTKNQEFTFELYEETSSGNYEYRDTITLTPGQEKAFSQTIPYNKSYYVKEVLEDSSYWETYYKVDGREDSFQTATNGKTDTIAAENYGTVVFNNSCEVKKISVDKQVENVWSMENGQKFTFYLYIDSTEGDPVSSLTLGKDETGTFEYYLLPGQKYYIQESQNSSEYTTTYGDGTAVTNEGFTSALKACNNSTVTFTNTYKLGTVKVTKTLVDEKGNKKADSEDQTFLFILTGKTKYNAGDDTKNITLYREVTIPAGETSADVTFTNVPFGTYTVTEADNQVYQQVSVTDSDDQNTTGDDEDGKITITGEAMDQAVAFENTRTNDFYYVDSDVRENVGKYDSKTEKYYFVK